jgi:chromosomal replication initiation ATPase DnaA
VAQLALPFDPPPRFERADLIEAESNAEARAWLGRTAEWPMGRLALWGPAGCGKTHLLHGWARQEGAEIVRGAALDPELVPGPPEGPVAIDDAEGAPELALLRLLNTAGEAGQAVLLASRVPPARWEVRLPDLASRLRAVTAVGIGPAEDGLLRLLLRRLLVERQIAVTEAVQAYLLLHLPRTPAAIRLAAARLDRAALAAGRAVTRGLAEAVLVDLIAPEKGGEKCDTPALAGVMVSPQGGMVV